MTNGYIIFITIVAVLCTAGLFYEDSGFAGAGVAVCLGMLITHWFLTP